MNGFNDQIVYRPRKSSRLWIVGGVKEYRIQALYLSP
jgi:hypothetical protein